MLKIPFPDNPMDDSRATVKLTLPSEDTQPALLLPPELSMLEPPPPIGEDSTQPLPLQKALREAESEIRAILGGPDATVAMKAGIPPPPQGPAQTQILPVPLAATQVLPAGPPPAPGPLETQAIPDSYYRETPAQAVIIPKKSLPGWAWALAALVLLGAGFGGTMLLLPSLVSSQKATVPSAAPASQTPPPAPPATSAEPAAEIPPSLRPYYLKAENGDATAMRTLGVMYYYGMNVPRNTEEGLRWYRKAAEAGSAAAKKDLKAIEGLK